MKKLTLIMLIVLFTVAGAVARAGAEEGITDTEIHIGTFAPLTGPAAMWGDNVFGLELIFKMANEAGGINGRKIIFHIIDDGYNPAKTKAGVKRLQEETGIFAWVGGVGTDCCLSVMDYLADRKVPWVAPLTGSDAVINPPRPNIFAFYPNNAQEAAVLSRYAVQELQKKRIAMVYQNDIYGVTGLKGAKAELVVHNLEIVAEIPVEKSDSELVKVALRLKKADADAVILWLSPLNALQVMQKGKYMGFNPQWLGPVSFCDFPATYKLSKGLIEGLIVDTCANPFSPLIPQYRKNYLRLGRPGVEWSTYLQGGAGIGQMVAEVLQRCGRDLNRATFIRELEKVQNFATMAGTATYGPFNAADPQSRNGIRTVSILQCLPGGEPKSLKETVPLIAR